MMVYQPNIPAATDQISQSQSDIQGNFQALGPIVNGVVSFPAQLTIPVIPLGTDALYAKVPAAPYPTTGVNELFLVKQDGINVPITAQGINLGVSWAYMPNGMILKWGQETATGTQQFVYPVALNAPAFTLTPTLILLTPVRTHATEDAQIYVDSFTGGANTNLQLGVYVTKISNPAANGTLTFRFLVMGF